MPSQHGVSMGRSVIYLDNAATTPVDPRVRDRMMECLTVDGDFANPASTSHSLGWEAAERVENARVQLAELINADPLEIVWTSGASEADNLALKGLLFKSANRHVVTSSYEHKAVLDTCEFLANNGCEVTYVSPSSDGTVSPKQVFDAIREDTRVVSIMHANNEVGTLNHIGEIAEICASCSVPFHVDAAQSVGKIPVDVKASNVDLMSISGHKIYGPKGIGALFVKRSIARHVHPLIHGGGHERGLRSGTLPTHQIVGFGEAAAICQKALPTEAVYLRELRNRLWSHLKQIPDVCLNGSEEQRLPGVINVAFPGVDGEVLLRSLDDVAISSGSACTSAVVEPSYVLRAMGIDDERAASSFRFSIGRFNSEWDIDHAAARLAEIVGRLRH